MSKIRWIKSKHVFFQHNISLHVIWNGDESLAWSENESIIKINLSTALSSTHAALIDY